MAERLQIRAVGRIGPREIRELSDVLVDCVEGGAAVHFMHPLPHAKAEAFWHGVAERLARGELALLLAEDTDRRIVATVQVILATPETQRHRGKLAKMLVHRLARRQGVGKALLAAAERLAIRSGRTLLVLGGAAERLYAQHGWQHCGTIPDYALWPTGELCDATFMYKHLGSARIRGSADFGLETGAAHGS